MKDLFPLKGSRVRVRVRVRARVRVKVRVKVRVRVTVGFGARVRVRVRENARVRVIYRRVKGEEIWVKVRVWVRDRVKVRVRVKVWVRARVRITDRVSVRPNNHDIGMLIRSREQRFRGNFVECRSYRAMEPLDREVGAGVHISHDKHDEYEMRQRINHSKEAVRNLQQ
jgi:hypothetical protein